MSEHKCWCAGCTKSAKQGAERERERIKSEIENAPIAFDFFGPYIARDKLLEILSGEN